METSCYGSVRSMGILVLARHMGVTNQLFLMFPAIPCQNMALMSYSLIFTHRT